MSMRDLTESIYDVASPTCRSIDALEAELVKLPQAEFKLIHRFTPGLYSRECFTPTPPEGMVHVGTSRIHRYEHQFMLLLGVVSIWVEGTGWLLCEAPYHGITKAGTRRVLMFHTDTICTTFHPNPTNESDIAKLEEMLYLTHDGPKAHFAAMAITT